MAEGVFGALSIARQNSYGTANTGSFHFIPFLDESISDTVDVLRPATLTGNFYEPAAVQGQEKSEGDFSVIMHPEKTGVLLRACFGQITTTTATVGSGYFEHEFIPKNSNFAAGYALNPHTIQVYRDTGVSYEYTDAQIHGISVSLAVNDFLKMKCSVIARTSSIMSTVSGNAPSDTPFVFDQASISFGGSGIVDFESVDIAFANNVAGVPVLDGNRKSHYFHRTDKMTVRVSGKINYIVDSYFVDFKAFTKKRFFVHMKDTSVASGNEITIDIPQMRFDTYKANIGGAGRISADFTATGEYSTASSYAVRVTLINSANSYA